VRPGDFVLHIVIAISDGEVFLLGEIVDGVFVPTEMSA